MRAGHREGEVGGRTRLHCGVEVRRGRAAEGREGREGREQLSGRDTLRHPAVGGARETLDSRPGHWVSVQHVGGSRCIYRKVCVRVCVCESYWNAALTDAH